MSLPLLSRALRTHSGTLQENIRRFEATARDCCGGDPTDKVSLHEYQLMYGMFLLPRIDHFHATFNKVYTASGQVADAGTKRKFKFLEIGMGCRMGYGPGKSVLLWKHLLKNRGDIWMAEADKAYVDRFVKDGHSESFPYRDWRSGGCQYAQELGFRDWRRI